VRNMKKTCFYTHLVCVYERMKDQGLVCREKRRRGEKRGDGHVPNELMPQMHPCTKILCSYMTMSEPE
jgi:hypothetical protein